MKTLDKDRGPRILSFGLHPHIVAVPHRMAEFRQMLDLLQARSDTIFVKPSQTLDWFEAATRDATSSNAS